MDSRQRIKVVHHSNAEHQQADWVGIHKRICPLLVPIRTLTLFQRTICTEIQLKKAELLEICRSVAQSKLSEGKHKDALPAAQFVLRCAIDVHGLNSVKLIPLYLLLAEARMGMGNLAMVAELLSKAEWVVLKSPECGHEVYQQLHRSLGHFHVASGNLDAAWMHFANDIYYASEAYGLESTATCKGYFLMADVFAKQEMMPVACSMYSEVARIWHCYLTNLLNIQVRDVQSSYRRSEYSFDKCQQAEADETLRTILEFWHKDSRKDPGQIAVAAHCLAMLGFLAGDTMKVLEFGNMALQACQLIPNYDLMESIQTLLQLVQSLQIGLHPGSD